MWTDLIKMNPQTSARNEALVCCLDLLAAERDTFEALDLAHHLFDTRPRFVEDLCEELRLVPMVFERIGDDRTKCRVYGGLPPRFVFAS